MFGEVYLPDHSFKLIYRFIGSQNFLSIFLSQSTGLKYLTVIS